MKTLVLGAGNLLLSDEGFGVHFIRYLEEHYLMGPDVELFDAGTLGLLAGHALADAHRLFIVDTVESDGTAGTCIRFRKSEFMHGRLPLKMSPHQVGVQEMLLVNELRGTCPHDVQLLGVIPANLEPGTELSSALRDLLPRLAVELATELGLTRMPKA